MNINKIAVIGHGMMGRGIIHSFAIHQFEIIAIKKRSEDQRFHEYLKNEVEKTRISKADYNEILSKVTTTIDIEEAAECDLVIESISENIEEKSKLFSVLGEICKPEAILATNTSSISIGKFGDLARRPDKIVGLHYMSPVPLMKLVEIIKTLETSEETILTAVEITKRISKIPIIVNDFPGFVSSRLVASLINESANILMQGVADVESIDNIAKLGLNLPVGPLQLADEVGLDVVINSIDAMYQTYRDTKYCACPLIRRMVEAGYLGKKNGKGFYNYN